MGLRNWPEVQAFPQRVRSQDLDLSATTRLAYRLTRKYRYETSPSQLLKLLSPPGDLANAMVLQIWPTGSRAGVYLTTSQTAIDALVAQYQDASDGAVFYAERAGSHHEAAIDLGDYGIWSSGLERVPSGTLIVLGPIKLDQQNWGDASERIEMACLHTANSGHRVAVLIDSPTPKYLHADARLMLTERSDDDLDEQIVGTVSDDGTLQEHVSQGYSELIALPSVARTSCLPDAVTSVQTSKGIEKLTDLYLGRPDARVSDSEKVYDFVAQHRALRIEEHLERLIKSGAIDIEGARQAGAGDRTLKRLIRLIERT